MNQLRFLVVAAVVASAHHSQADYRATVVSVSFTNPPRSFHRARETLKQGNRVKAFPAKNGSAHGAARS